MREYTVSREPGEFDRPSRINKRWAVMEQREQSGEITVHSYWPNKALAEECKRSLNRAAGRTAALFSGGFSWGDTLGKNRDQEDPGIDREPLSFWNCRDTEVRTEAPYGQSVRWLDAGRRRGTVVGSYIGTEGDLWLNVQLPAGRITNVKASEVVA